MSLADANGSMCINEWVDAFESARANDPNADLARFLPSADHPFYLEGLTELIRVEMEYLWRDGRVSVEHYLARFPSLVENTECVCQLAFEEFRQRREHGEMPTAAEYAARLSIDVSDWPSSIPFSSVARAGSVRRGRRSSLGPYEPMANGSPVGKGYPGVVFPAVGSTYLGFRLLTELGRGAFSRVFLACQDDLAERFVALKVSAQTLGESQTLARLQHPHVVPIYSVHRLDRLEAICMPFLGATTLQDLLTRFPSGAVPRSTTELLALWQACRRPLPLPQQGTSMPESPTAAPEPTAFFAATRETSEPLRYEDIIIWLGARLAEGLAHAHDRGVLHLDLKPANVLLTDRGQPMLFDFNLASHTWKTDSENSTRVGGTFPYMAPEHLEAFLTLRGNVDGRADIYSLGVLLYRLLAGRHPFSLETANTLAGVEKMLEERRQAPPSPRLFAPGISKAVEAIIFRCLQPRREDRYREARQLGEDLQRQFDRRELAHTPEPSRWEGWRKWWSRRPGVRVGVRVGLVALLLLLALAAILWRHSWKLEQFQRQQRWELLDRESERVRYLLHAPHPDLRQLSEGLALCRDLLDGNETFMAQQNSLERTDSAARERLAELFFLRARAAMAHWRLRPGSTTPGFDDWLYWNQQALARFGSAPPGVLLRQRAEILAWKGDHDLAQQCRELAKTSPARTTNEQFWEASELVAQARWQKGEAYLHQVTERDPKHLWAWIGLGHCQAAQSRDADAIASFGIAIALKPDWSWPYYLRGLARLQQNQFAEASRDFGAAITREPNWWEPWLARASARRHERNAPAAFRDLEQARDLGAPPVRCHALAALVARDGGNSHQRETSLRQAMVHESYDALCFVTRGLARLPEDPRGALADFNQALTHDPLSRQALQNKAHVLAEVLRRPEEALDALDRVIQWYPEYLPARSGRAVVLARLQRRAEAHEEANRCITRSRSPALLYQLAGVYALTSPQQPRDAARAFEYLELALRGGFGAELLAKDPDLTPLRSSLRFRELLPR